MRRLLSFLLVAFAALNFAHADSSLDAITHTFAALSGPIAQIGGGIFGTPRVAQVVTVAKSGARFRVICGADCTLSSSTCAPGSAVNSITGSSATNPFTIDIAPGLYEECIRVQDKSGISFIGSGTAATIIRPPVTSATDVDGGCFSWQGDGSVAESSDFAIDQLTIHCDDVAIGNQAAAALQIGFDTDPGTETAAALWTKAKIGPNIKLIGGSQGAFLAGDYVGSNAANVPTWTASGEFIGGRVGFEVSGLTNGRLTNYIARSWTNYCDVPDSAVITGSITPVSGGANTITFAETDIPAALRTHGTLDGRKITLTGAGSCAANNGDTRDIDITNDGGANMTITSTRNFDAAPDPNCTFTISPRTMAAEAPCTDKNWSALLNSNWSNVFPVMLGEDGGGGVTHGVSNDGSLVVISNGYQESWCNNSCDAANKRGPGVLVRFNRSEKLVVSNILAIGAQNYEQGPAGAACSVNTAVHMSYPSEIENYEIYNVTHRYHHAGANCDAWGVSGTHASQNLRAVSVTNDMTRPTTVNGVTITGGFWDLDSDVLGAVDAYRFADFKSLDKSLRSRAPGNVFYAGFMPQKGESVALIDGTAAIGEVADGAADTCMTMPIFLPNPIMANVLRAFTGAGSAGGAGDHAICIYDSTGTVLEAGWEGLTGAASQSIAVTETATLGGFSQNNRLLAPGHHQLAWCTNSGTATLTGYPSSAGARMFGVGTCSPGTTGNVCPATCANPNAMAIPNRLEITINE